MMGMYRPVKHSTHDSLPISGPFRARDPVFIRQRCSPFRAGMPKRDSVGHPASPGGRDAQGPGRGPGGATVIGVGNQSAGSRRL